MFAKSVFMISKNMLFILQAHNLTPDGEPHAFSMWACLFADPGLVRVLPEELERLSSRMVSIAKQFKRLHKIWPHPAQLHDLAKEEEERTRGRMKK